MKQEEPKLYEGMYIISAQLNDDGRLKVLDKIKADIAKNGGEVKKVHDLKKKPLQYQIGRHKEGHYFLLYFTVNPSAMNEMWKEYRLNENIVRFLTMRTDKVVEELKFKELPEQ